MDVITKLTMKLNKNIRFLSIGKKLEDITEINIEQITFEDELKKECDINSFISELKEYQKRKINK